MLNIFKDDMKDNMNKLKKVMDEENILHAKLNKLNDNVEKINKYTENTDDKKANIKKELDNNNKEYNVINHK